MNWRQDFFDNTWLILAVMALCLVMLLFFTREAKAEVVDIERLADAIYIAEGGAKTNHPYGILTKYKTTTPRQACINTIKSGLKRFAKQTEEKDFIVFLGKTYCPIGAKNDPKGLNKNWVKNVTYHYERGIK